MSTLTDNDLRELKDLINSKFEQINEKIDNRYQLLDNKLNDMRVDIAILKEGQNSLNVRVDETKEAINKRIDNLDFIARSVVGGILVALLVGFVKMLYPNLFG